MLILWWMFLATDKFGFGGDCCDGMNLSFPLSLPSSPLAYERDPSRTELSVVFPKEASLTHVWWGGEAITRQNRPITAKNLKLTSSAQWSPDLTLWPGWLKQISNDRVKGVRNEPSTQITEFIFRHPVTGRDSTKWGDEVTHTSSLQTPGSMVHYSHTVDSSTMWFSNLWSRINIYKQFHEIFLCFKF